MANNGCGKSVCTWINMYYVECFGYSLPLTNHSDSKLTISRPVFTIGVVNFCAGQTFIAKKQKTKSATDRARKTLKYHARKSFTKYHKGLKNTKINLQTNVLNKLLQCAMIIHGNELHF